MLQKKSIWMCAVALFLLLEVSQSQSIVETLPGYDGDLPFKLETGYIGVGEKEEIQFFYYFMESERNPEIDPLLIWFCGGPGCSVLSSIIHQIGPFEFDVKASNSTFVRLRRRENSWTQIANVLFFDTPIGTGFSYSTTPEGYSSSDSKSITHYHQFIQKWLIAHPQFLNNPLFIGGDSYAGKTVPPLVYEIIKGNEEGQNPKLSIQGYLVGNPLTHLDDKETNWHMIYANRMGLISDKYFEQAKKNCGGGKYIYPDPNNTACTAALDQIQMCLRNTNYMQILEPTCVFPVLQDLLSFNPSNYVRQIDQEYNDPEKELRCRDRSASVSPIWANLPAVQKALYVREGTIGTWSRCNRSIDSYYQRDIESAYPYHKLLTTKPIQALVYSGDHDFVVPWIVTFDWIQRLNLTLSEDWRPWVVDSQNAGFTMRYKYTNYFLTFATVKGGGHTPQEQRPKECLAMVDRWFNLYPL